MVELVCELMGAMVRFNLLHTHGGTERERERKGQEGKGREAGGEGQTDKAGIFSGGSMYWKRKTYEI